MSNKKLTTRDKLMKKQAKEMEDQIMDQLLENNRVTPEQIRLYTKAKHALKDVNVENPMYVLDNVDLMKLRYEFYNESILDVIRKNDDSLTEESAQKLLNNEYTIYLKHMLNI